MKKVILSAIFLSLSIAIFAQSTYKFIKKAPANTVLRKNTFSVEGAGQNGMGAGFSYQRLLWGNYRTFLSGSVGVGIPISLQTNAKNSLNSPYINQNLLFNFGGKGSYGEIGLGGTFGKLGANSNLYTLYPMLGYRFQPLAGRVFFHLYFMPIFSETRTSANDVNPSQTCFDCPIPDGRNAIRPWGGFGAGYNF
ncbi:MAG: hypothetical protein RI894_2575 [Bacteroidota bacterium]|jgi:hypothetical protein